MPSSHPLARLEIAFVASNSSRLPEYDHVLFGWVGGRAYEHPSIFKCYGAETLADFDKPELQKTYDFVSAIQHVSKDDPPIFMFFNEPDRDLPPDAKPGQGIHHPRFAHQLKKALDRVGVESLYHHQSEFTENPHLEMVKFFKRQFGR